MNIRLKPEWEKRVEQDVRRGPYRTADEFVEHAVVLLNEQETWLAEKTAEISAKIGEGYAAAKRGELIDAEQARVSMDQRKREWLADKREA